MPFDVNGARRAGYSDPEIVAYLSYSSGERIDDLPGTDDEKIAALLERRQRKMLPVEYAQPKPSFTMPPVDEEAIYPEYLLNPGHPKFFKDPFEAGAEQVAGGWKRLWEPSDTTAADPRWWDTKAGAASDIIRGTMPFGMMAMPMGIASAPLQTALGLGAGMGAQAGTEHLAERAGVPPGQSRLLGDIAGLWGGAMGPHYSGETIAFGRALEKPAYNFLVDESGEITIGPSKGWTSTLRDLIEAKAPGKVQPEQLRSIAGQAPAEEVRWSNLAELTGRPGAKSEILGAVRQPEITEVLRTPPDTKYGSFTLPGGEKSSELLLQLGSPSRYRSGHWEEPNVFAHTRFNERTTPAGERVLFLEELQSDWHQAGRKGGYADPAHIDKLRQEQLNAEGQANRAFEIWKQEADDLLMRDPEADPHTLNSYKEYERLSDKGNELYIQRTKAQEGVPAAPFSKDWHELVMKRMLREAVDQGYDKLAWTTGEQQNQRYNLSKHFDRLEWAPSERGTQGYFVAYDTNGKIVHQNQMSESELPGVIGDELAARLLSQPTVKQDSGPGMGRYAVRDVKTLPNADLEVGGEGMKGFYDKILPDFARKYGKKFGSTVSQSEIVGGHPTPVYEGPQYDVRQFENWMRQKRDAWQGPNRTPEGWNAWNVTLDRQAQRVYDAMRAGSTFAEAMAKEGTLGLADELGGAIRMEPSTGTYRVHSMDITPAMREAIRKGQPMFGSAAPLRR